MSAQEHRLTVAIPAYNAEKYIRRCLDSVVSQNYNGFEVLIVDDCSTDSTGDICAEYSGKYPFVKTLRHGVNMGAGMAKHTAIMSCTGEYMIFIDTDDYFTPDALGKLTSYLDESTDLVIGQHERYTAAGEKPKQYRFTEGVFETGSGSYETLRLIYDSTFGVEGWNKIYRTSILKEISKIENTMRIGEDMLLNVLYYLYMRGRIICIADITYMYEFRADSLARSSEKSMVVPQLAELLVKMREASASNDTYFDKMYPYVFYYPMSVILANYARGDDASKSHVSADLTVLHESAEVRGIAEDYFGNGIRREKCRIIKDRQRRTEIDCFYRAVMTGDVWYYTKLLPAKLEKKHRNIFVLKAWIKKITGLGR